MSMSNKLAKMETITSLNGGGILPRRDAPQWATGVQRYMGPMMNMGDPGLFGDIFSGIKKIGRVATGLVGGLGIPVVSGVARTAGGILFGGGMRNTIAGASTRPLAAGGVTLNQAGQWASPGIAFQGTQYETPGIAGAAQRFFKGGATGYQAPPPTGSMGGYHLNKSGYFLMDGTYVAPGSKWVKNRRRNPGNMKALSRSLGRIKSAKRMTQALSAISIRSSCPPGRSRKRS